MTTTITVNFRAGLMQLNKLTLLPICGFIAQLVEHRTGIAEVMGSNPVEALIFFFRLLLSNCLNWKIYCDDHTSLSLQSRQKTVQGDQVLIHTTPEKFENAVLFLRIELLSTLIRHQNGALRNRCSNRK